MPHEDDVAEQDSAETCVGSVDVVVYSGEPREHAATLRTYKYYTAAITVDAVRSTVVERFEDVAIVQTQVIRSGRAERIVCGVRKPGELRAHARHRVVVIARYRDCGLTGCSAARARRCTLASGNRLNAREGCTRTKYFRGAIVTFLPLDGQQTPVVAVAVSAIQSYKSPIGREGVPPVTPVQPVETVQVSATPVPTDCVDTIALMK